MYQLKPIAKVDVSAVNNHLDFKDFSGPEAANHHLSGQDKILGERCFEFSSLNDLHVSLSPGGEILALANHRTLCILSAKWDSYEEEEVKTKFKVSWRGDPCHNERERITAVLCLPLILPSKPSRSSHSSEQCSLDWTCIAVGFDSGFVRFYEENGGLLLSEKVYNEPVEYLKCQSYQPSMYASYDDFPEEVYVSFRTIVAVIPGFALFQTLRACRNQLARVKANYAESFVPPPLALKKWAFVEQEKLTDCEVIGPSSSDLFDHLMTASICGGFNTCYRSGAPKSTLVIAVGKSPFIGFHHALEGVEGRSVLTDVALAVKSKFKGLFRSSGTDQQKSTTVIEAPDNLACRFGICDFYREADHIVRSPNREYSVVTDALGRVTLVHNFRGIVIKMWKGYRKAQCGWLQVEEEEPSTKGNPKHLLRTVLFLVIYDPKKGMLEVWTVPNGVRIAAFSCSKKGRLLYTSYGLIGLNNFALRLDNKSLSPCVFLDPLGVVFQIVVPFHCALSDGTSERASDLALLRKLKVFLRETDLDDEQLAQEVGLIAAELKTMEVRKQMLTALTSNKHVTVEALEAALAVFIDRVTTEDQKCLDNQGLSLITSSQQLRNLIGLYKFVYNQRECPPNYSSVVPQKGISDLQAVCDVLSISDQELTRIKSLISLLNFPTGTEMTPKREIRVTFDEGGSLKRTALLDYISCFDFGKKSPGAAAPNAVSLKKLSKLKMINLAELLFQGILYGDVPIDVWQAEAACSGILPSDLLRVAVQFWLQRYVGKALEVEMIRFSEVIKAICLLEEVNSCDLAPLWSSVRTTLVESDQPFNALMAALVCRAVAFSLEKHSLKKHSKSPNKSKQSSTEQRVSDHEGGKAKDVPQDPQKSNLSDNEGKQKKRESRKPSAEWEDVSWDSVKWNMLIGRLEDVALLDRILCQNPSDFSNHPEESVLPCLRYEKPIISFGNLLQKGKGAISELVAKWLTSSGLDPKLLIDKSDLEWVDRIATSTNSPKIVDIDEPGPEDKSEVIVREGIPLKAEEGIEALTLCGAHMQILNNVNLLKRSFPYSLCGSVLVANLSWELILEWHKAPEQLHILKGSILCLQTVPNIHVQQGLSNLIWSSHLRETFKAATKIVDECSANPKEKLCRKELQMSSTQLADFFGICVQFIESFIEATNNCEVIRPPGLNAVVNRSEDLWEYDEHITPTTTQSLTNLALLQPQASFDHLHLLYQLAETIHMILSLGLKGQQLKPLFKSTDWSTFFSDTTHLAEKMMQHSVEPQLLTKRSQFLMRAVSGAMQNVLSSDPSHVTDMSDGVSTDMSLAMRWFGKCQKLAYTWQVGVDPLRRHQVSLLYSAGHDRLAEEILPAVNALDNLSRTLLCISGQRLKLIISSSDDLMEKISNLDRNLTDWLYELNTKGVRKVSLPDIFLLTTHVLQHLPEDDPERPLAEDLYDAVQALMSYNDE